MLLRCIKLISLYFLSQLLHAEPMKFSTGFHGNCYFGCQWVQASGEITTHTLEDLKKFFTENGMAADLIIFDSSGGDLITALKLGEFIRENNLSTSIGKTIPDDNMFKIVEGECASACAYAYLGGSSRMIGGVAFDDAQTGRLGFHQFYNKNISNKTLVPHGSEVDLAVNTINTQLISAVLVDYLETMGIKPDLYTVIGRTPPGSIYWLSQDEMIKYKIIPDPIPATWVWTIRPSDKGVYAELILDRENSQRARDAEASKWHILIYCKKGKNYLTVKAKDPDRSYYEMFQHTEGSTDVSEPHFLLNEEFDLYPTVLIPPDIGGFTYMIFSISPQQAKKIASYKKFDLYGVSMSRYLYASGFMNFFIGDIAPSSNVIDYTLSHCLK